VLSYTDVEKAVILSHNLDSTRVAKCPWVTEVASDVPGFEGRADIAYLGGFGHHPNVEAVEWFVAKVMPLMREALPGVKFRVYGSNIPKSLLALAEKDDNLVIEGWVPSVDAVYKTCRVFIAPLQSGAGIKGKVIGALASGVPCVLSSIAAEGIPMVDDVVACIADKPEEWVSDIARLYNDRKLWADMSKQARVFSQNLYSFNKGVVQMRDALQQAEIFTDMDNGALALR
jgi:glycosyltransferase involved in cell wall biosynthesis